MKNTNEYSIVDSNSLFTTAKDLKHKEALFKQTSRLRILNNSLLESITRESSGRKEVHMPNPVDTDWHIQAAMFRLFDGTDTASVILNKRNDIVAIFTKDNPLLTEPIDQESIHILLSEDTIRNSKKANEILSKIQQELSTKESVAA